MDKGFREPKLSNFQRQFLFQMRSTIQHTLSLRSDGTKFNPDSFHLTNIDELISFFKETLIYSMSTLRNEPTVPSIMLEGLSGMLAELIMSLQQYVNPDRIKAKFRNDLKKLFIEVNGILVKNGAALYSNRDELEMLLDLSLEDLINGIDW